MGALTCCGTPTRPPAQLNEAAQERFADLAPPSSRKRFTFEGLENPPPPPPPAARTEEGEEAKPELVQRQAALRMRLPEGKSFVLHATLPLPLGLPTTDLSFELRDRSGKSTWARAQWEVVTRYPTGEPEVVELAALLQRPQGTQPGQWHTFDVRVVDPQPSGPAPDVAWARGAAWPDGLELRCRDIHGHLYRALLNGPQAHRIVLAKGTAYERVRLYATLMPAPDALVANPPALPHLMGVHAYLTRRSGDERVSLDLRINNGATSGGAEPAASESPAGIVYWDSLELALPQDWSATALVRDPLLGKARKEEGRRILPLVKPLPGGALHMMGPQAQFLRRLTLHSPSSQAPRGEHPSLSGLAFCVAGPGLWSWWNPQTSRYFPQRTPLARWDTYRRNGLVGQAALEERIGTELHRLRTLLTSGVEQPGILSGPLMGWAHPLGVSIQGMTGGSGIEPIVGQRTVAAADARGVEALMLRHRMHACRQPDAQWNRMGQAVGPELWRGEKKRVPFDFRTNANMVPHAFKLPARGGPAASDQVKAVYEAELRPPYDLGTPAHAGGRIPGNNDSLLAWWPHDGQHMVRYTSATKALVWLTNDALARDSLIHAAELFHLAFHGGRHAVESWSPGATLRVYEGLVDKHPGHGLPIGRDQAWGMDAACAAYSCATPSWRQAHRDWLIRIAQLLVDGAMSSGIVQRQVNPKVLGARHASSQTFESHFLLHAERCLIESVLEGVDPERSSALLQLHHRALDFLYWGPVWSDPRPTLHSETPLAGPRWHFAVAPKEGFEAAPYCENSRWGEDYLPADGLDLGVETRYGWGPLQYAMSRPTQGEADGLESRYLARSLDLGVHSPDVHARVRGLFREAAKESSDHSGSWAGYVGALQNLGVL
ncbi:MAG TPA: hypothetical protein EYQ74_01295 [Planctomycetes bacterium]|nr:hypothetical protein [Planctomycetota bacterium]HIK60708.1 hypothetical protein [Planctomycetota bacterium]